MFDMQKTALPSPHRTCRILHQNLTLKYDWVTNYHPQVYFLKNYRDRWGQIIVKFHATDHGIDWNRFSLVLLFKEPRIYFLIDIGVPLDMLGMLLKNWKKHETTALSSINLWP